ncbi:MAG TPA: hypothetical protein VGK18_11260 [Propionicimonas sp.]|jgi:hypothetical protein|uniref:hypothetical protein n=1 Tax=Propionicimonas sp. TaxID=1955623 RepID=UPI002F42EA83
MGLFDRLLAAVGSPQPAEIRRLATRVPPNAEYCTLGLFQVFAGPPNPIAGQDPLSGFRQDPSLVPRNLDAEARSGILVLGSGALRVLTESGEVWSCPLNQVREVDAHRQSGFVVTGPYDRLAASNQMPVPLPTGSDCRTAGRVTNRLFGWDAVLQPYGVTIRW